MTTFPQSIMLLASGALITRDRIDQDAIDRLVSLGRAVVRANSPRLTVEPLVKDMNSADIVEFNRTRTMMIALLARDKRLTIPGTDGTVDEAVIESLCRDGIARRVDEDSLILDCESPLTDAEVESALRWVQSQLAAKKKAAEQAAKPKSTPVSTPVEKVAPPPTPAAPKIQPKPAAKPTPVPAAELSLPPALVAVLEKLATNSQHTVNGLEAIWRQLGGGTENTVVVKARRSDPTVEEVAQRIAVVLYLAEEHMLMPSRIKNYKLSELQKLKADSAIKHGLETRAFKKVGPFLKLVAPEPLKLSWTELQQLKRRRERVS